MIEIRVTGTPILIRNKLSEIKLRDYIEFMKLRQRETEIVRDMEFQEFEIEEAFGVKYLHEVTEEQQKENPEEYSRLFEVQTDFLITKLEVMSEQLKVLCASELSRKEVDNIPENMLSLFIDNLELELEQEYSANAYVIIPDVNSEQIKDMEEEIASMDKAFDAEKIHRYKARIEALREGKLILKPVKDAIFASYMRAAAIEQAIPQQDKELFTQLEEQEINPQEYEANRKHYLSNVQTVKERKELRDRDRLVRTFLATTETNFMARIPELVSLFLVPEHEPFSLYYTKKREAYIKELYMDQLFGLINFIEAVLSVSKVNTATSSPSSLLTMSRISPSLLQSGSTILENMGGSQLSEMFS